MKFEYNDMDDDERVRDLMGTTVKVHPVRWNPLPPFDCVVTDVVADDTGHTLIYRTNRGKDSIHFEDIDLIETYN